MGAVLVGRLTCFINCAHIFCISAFSTCCEDYRFIHSMTPVIEPQRVETPITTITCTTTSIQENERRWIDTNRGCKELNLSIRVIPNFELGFS